MSGCTASGRGDQIHALFRSKNTYTSMQATMARDIWMMSGHALVAPATRWPAICAITAPNNICVQPSRPEAVPAASGRTLTAPAIAFGSTMPLPIEIKAGAVMTARGPS